MTTTDDAAARDAAARYAASRERLREHMRRLHAEGRISGGRYPAAVPRERRREYRELRARGMTKQQAIAHMLATPPSASGSAS